MLHSQATVHVTPSSSTSQTGAATRTTDPRSMTARRPSPVNLPSPARMYRVSSPLSPSIIPLDLTCPLTRYILLPGLTSPTTKRTMAPLSASDDPSQPFTSESQLCSSAAKPPGTYFAPRLCGENAGGRPSVTAASSSAAGLKRGAGRKIGCAGRDSEVGSCIGSSSSV